MKSFLEIITEAKAYNKKGKMYVLKEPKHIEAGNKSFLILAFGKDTNGNPLMRIEFRSGKKKSVQVPYSITLMIDEIVKNGLSKHELDAILTVI